MARIFGMSVKDGRWTLAAIILVVSAVLAILGTTRGYHAIWEIWNVPQMTPHFADLRNLTAAGDSIRLGYDPLIENPADPRSRPLNQPRVVQFIISGLGITQADTTPLAVLIISLFVAGILLSLRPIPNKTAWILAVVIFSPAVMLGVERCNHDLLMFFLVALALAWPSARLFSLAILMLASVIKLFPIFSVALFLRHNFKQFMTMASIFVGLFCLYMLANYKDLPLIFATTQKGFGVWAYGTRTFFRASSLWQSYIPMLIAIPAVVMRVGWLWRAGSAEAENSDYIDGFRVGAAIYLGTFLLGNNWDYRFIFLIFVIPQLVAWSQERDKRFVSFATLVAIIVSCWTLAFREAGLGVIVLDEMANWQLFIALFYLTLISLPSWAHTAIRQASWLSPIEPPKAY
jgi:hypothetical protein